MNAIVHTCMNAIVRTAVLLMLLAVSSGLAAAPAPAGGPYVDARDYPTPAQGWARFRAVEALLVRGFDDICGDTFCEGEYSNLQALRFRCSVQQASGRVQACAWTFTGSTASVDSSTGQIEVDARTWTCPTPLLAGTPLELLLATLEQAREDALHTPLPGTPDSIYDGLTDCL